MGVIDDRSYEVEMVPFRLTTEKNFDNLKVTAEFTHTNLEALRDELVAMFGPGDQWVDRDEVKRQPPHVGVWVH